MVCEEEITTANRIKMLSTSLLSNLHSGLKCIQPIQTDSKHKKATSKFWIRNFLDCVKKRFGGSVKYVTASAQ